MKTAFLIYSLDVEDSLNNYWTVGFDNTACPLILDNEDGEIIDDVLGDIRDGEDFDERVMYLGAFNLNPYSMETFDAVSIDISKMDLELFFKKHGLTQKPASSFLHNENALLHALMMKFINIKTTLSINTDPESEDVESEENLNSEENGEEEIN